MLILTFSLELPNTKYPVKTLVTTNQRFFHSLTETVYMHMYTLLHARNSPDPFQSPVLELLESRAESTFFPRLHGKLDSGAPGFGLG